MVKKEEKGETKKLSDKILQVSHISLSMNGYNDIFSSFDARPYSQKALSDDFLFETKKASKDKKLGKFDMRIIIPEEKRNKTEEKTIKKRLKEHYTRHYFMLKNEINGITKRGVLFVIFGIISMFIASYLIVSHQTKGLLLSFIIVLLEPGGWFLFWEGLDILIFETKGIKPDLEFYKKMVNCNIEFLSR